MDIQAMESEDRTNEWVEKGVRVRNNISTQINVLEKRLISGNGYDREKTMFDLETAQKGLTKFFEKHPPMF